MANKKPLNAEGFNTSKKNTKTELNFDVVAGLEPATP